MRGSLASLLCLGSLFGNWLIGVVVAVFATSWKNQTAEDWQSPQDSSRFKARPRAGKAVKIPSPEKITRAVECRTDRRPYQNKRLRLSNEAGSLEEQPLKRLRHKSKNQWRFWLPHSSEMEGEEPLRPPFAGGNSSDKTNKCEHLAPEAGLDRLLVVGKGICPKKLGRAGNLVDQFDQNPSGRDSPCVRMEEEREAVNNEPYMGSSAAEKSSEVVEAADLRCLLMWRHDTRAVRIVWNHQTPLMLSGIFGRDIRSKLRRNPTQQRYPTSSGIRIPNSLWEARLCLGNSEYSGYKNNGLHSTRPPNLERWCASIPETQSASFYRKQEADPDIDSGKQDSCCLTSSCGVMRDSSEIGSGIQSPGSAAERRAVAGEVFAPPEMASVAPSNPAFGRKRGDSLAPVAMDAAEQWDSAFGLHSGGEFTLGCKGSWVGRLGGRGRWVG
ncbi:unnamed protein product [Linum trigynum]|uniref:Uncharacterized protein n=1 Tax=Linum trigynum TaxID=586398 RepID=A0AAV2F3I0_9ROSI